MSDGVLYVEILPTTKGIGKAVEKDVTGAFSTAEKKSTGLFSKVQKGLKWAAIGVAGVAGTVSALAVKGGISRALNIEDAQAKLKGLGHDTKSVDAIMTNALASVKGTAFGLDAAATTAAAAVASGIKPGKELERYLRLTADAATIAGVSMEEMGSIVNKVQAKGKAQMEDLNRLTERGIPILQMLADEYGVSAEEMSKMVSKGEVDAARFRKALEDNVGGAALESGNTTRGAFANMMAALSRLGLVFVGDGLAGAKTFFNEVTVILDGVGERIGPLVDWVQEKLGGMFQVEGMGQGFLDWIDSFNIGEIANQLLAGRGSFIAVGIRLLSGLIEGLVGAVPQIVETLAQVISQVTGALQQYAPQILQGAVTLFLGLATGLLETLPMIMETLSLFIPALLSALIGMLPAIISAGTTLFLGLVTSLAEVLPGLIAAVVAMIPQLVSAITGAVPLIVSSLAAALPLIIDAGLQLFLGVVLGLVQALPQIIEAVVGLVPALISALLDMIPVLIEGAVQLLMGLIQALPIVIPQLIEAVFAGILEVVGALAESIPLILDAAILLFTSLVEALPIILPDLIVGIIGLIPTIVSTLIGLIPTLVSAAVQLFMGLVLGLVTVLPKLFTKMGELWPGIWASISDIPSKMLSAGQDMIQGLIDGVGGMIGNAVQAVKDVGGAMLDGIKGFLGIHSPSRVFRDEVGKMVGLGLLDGVGDEAIKARIDRKVSHLVDIPQFDSTFAGAGPLVDSLTINGNENSRIVSDLMFALRTTARGGVYAR